MAFYQPPGTSLGGGGSPAFRPPSHSQGLAGDGLLETLRARWDLSRRGELVYVLPKRARRMGELATDTSVLAVGWVGSGFELREPLEPGRNPDVGWACLPGCQCESLGTELGAAGLSRVCRQGWGGRLAGLTPAAPAPGPTLGPGCVRGRVQVAVLGMAQLYLAVPRSLFLPCPERMLGGVCLCVSHCSVGSSGSAWRRDL